MTKMTGPNRAVICNLIHTHYILHARRNLQSEYLNVVLLDQRVSSKAWTNNASSIEYKG